MLAAICFHTGPVVVLPDTLVQPLATGIGTLLEGYLHEYWPKVDRGHLPCWGTFHFVPHPAVLVHFQESARADYPCYFLRVGWPLTMGQVTHQFFI